MSMTRDICHGSGSAADPEDYAAARAHSFDPRTYWEPSQAEREESDRRFERFFGIDSYGNPVRNGGCDRDA